MEIRVSYIKKNVFLCENCLLYFPNVQDLNLHLGSVFHYLTTRISQEIKKKQKKDVDEFLAQEDVFWKSSDDFEDCPICFQKIYANKKVLECGHIFDKHCLNMWDRQKIEKTCPVCRDKRNKEFKDFHPMV